jgi:hypothetical protein
VQRGHQHPRGVERQRRRARVGGTHRIHVQGRPVEQRRLGRIAQPGAGVVAQHGRQSQRCDVAVRRPRRLDAHPVAGQRAGLVRRHHGRGPERLDRGQPAHDGAARGHPPRADRQRDRHHRGQPLGHRGDREADCRHGRFAAREPAQRGQRADDDGEYGDRARDGAPEPAQVAGERGVQRAHAADQRGDPAELGVRARGHRDTSAAARGDERPRVDHAAALGQRGVQRHRRRALRHGLRLAGQRRLLGPQRGRVQHAQIGHHPLALGHLHEVARHDVVGGHLGPRAVAPHTRGLGDQRGERGDRPPRLILLSEAEQGVQDDHGQHDEAVLALADRQRQDTGSDEREDERRAQLVDQQPRSGCTGGSREPVRSRRGQPRARLGAAQAGAGRPQRGERVGHRAGMPAGAARRGGSHGADARPDAAGGHRWPAAAACGEPAAGAALSGQPRTAAGRRGADGACTGARALRDSARVL